MILESAASAQLTFKTNLLAYLVLFATNSTDLLPAEAVKILEVLNTSLDRVKESVVHSFLTDEIVEFITQNISSSEEFSQVNGIYLKSYWYRLARTSMQKLVDKLTKISIGDQTKCVKKVFISKMFLERMQEEPSLPQLDFTPSQMRLILFCFEDSARKLMEIIQHIGEDFFQLEVLRG